MSPQEPQNSGPESAPPQNEPTQPEELQLLSSSPADTEPATQPNFASPQDVTASTANDPVAPLASSGSVDASASSPAPTSTEPVTPAFEPVPAPSAESAAPFAAPLAAPKKSPKRLVITIIAAVLVLLALGGGVAFAVWYNSPQKVLNDSLGNLLNTPPKSADVTAAVSVDDTNFKVTVASYSENDNAQANVKFDMTSGGTAVNINVDAIAAKNGDLYIRVNDAKKLVAQFTQGSPEAAAMFEGILTKVDTKWVKITEADLKELTGGEKSPDSECVNNAVTAFQNDAGQKKEVTDLYVKNQFITVKEQKADEVVDGRNSFHYVLDADEAKAKAFGEGLKQTQIYKKVKECLGDSFKDDSSSSDSSSDDDTTASVEVWIDKSTRQISKLNLTATSAKEKGNAKIDAILGYKTRSITLPTTTTTLDELQEEFQNIIGASLMQDEDSFETTLLEQ